MASLTRQTDEVLPSYGQISPGSQVPDLPPSYYQSNKATVSRNPLRTAGLSQTPGVQEKRIRKFIERIRSQSVFADPESLRGNSEALHQSNEFGIKDQNPAENAAPGVVAHSAAPQKRRTFPEPANLQYFDALRAQLDEISDPVGKTCQWINEQKGYKRWLSSNSNPDNVLIILADPAYGKTVLAKFIFVDLDKKENSVMAFFCKREVSGRRTTSSILASFIYQLFCQNQTLLHHISEKRLEKTEELAFANLWELFDDLLSDDHVKDHIFIIDAFDECDERSQQELQKSLFKWTHLRRPRFLITARAVPYPRLLCQRFPYLEISPKSVSQDVAQLLDYKLRSQGIDTFYEAEMVELLRQNIEQGSQGMFLVIEDRLRQFNDARDDPNFSTSRASLREFFSRRSGLLRDFYATMISNVTLLEKNRRDTAVSIFNILLSSQRPLDNSELSAAYEFSIREFEDYDKYLESHRETDIINSAERMCGPIVRPRDNDYNRKTISIVHPSACEFLEDEGDPSSSDPQMQLLAQVSQQSGHVLLAKACLRFLLLPEMSDIRRSSFSEYPFLAYSILHWQVHVRESRERVIEYGDLLADFFAPSSTGYREWDIVVRCVKNGLEPITLPERPTPVAISLVEYELMNVLHMAAATGPEHTPILFGRSLDVDSTDELGRTALSIALGTKRFIAAKELLNLGASAQIAMPDGLTPLHLAVLMHSVEMVKELVSKGALIDAETPAAGGTPLFYSAELAPDIFELLLSLGAKAYVSKDDHWSILHVAAQRGDLSLVKSIIERKLILDVNCATVEGYTPLMAAAGTGKSLDVIKYLVLEHGANVDMATEKGGTALYEAVCDGNLDIISFLLPLVADKDVATEGWTSLHISVCNGLIDVTTKLIEGGLNINSVNRDHRTPLFIAVDEKHYKLAIQLIRSGADVNVKDTDGITALYLASGTEHLDLVNELLSAGADPRTSVHNTGMSCLHRAAYSGYLEVVKSIVAARGVQGDVDEKEESWGLTPLIAAIRENNTEVAKFLLSVNANANIELVGGWTSVHVAAAFTKDEGLFRHLVAKLPRKLLSAPTNTGSTPLHLAAGSAFLKAMEILLEQNVDPTLPDDSYCTPLYQAALSGSSQAVQLLLARSLPNIQTKWGWTALHAACKKCNGSTVENLMKVTNWLSRRRSSYTPLQIAIKNKNPEATNALLEGGMPVNMSVSWGSSALHEAADVGNHSLIVDLLRYGADVDALNCRGTLPIFLAYKFRDADLVGLLRPTAAARLWKNNLGLESPIHLAARFSLQEVKLLEERGLRCFTKCALSNTALSAAIEYYRHELVEHLLCNPRVQQDVNLPILFGGWTPVHLAARRCNDQILGLLIKNASVDLELKDYFGLSVFDYAMKHSSSLLILADANPIKFRVWLQESSSEEYRKQFMIHQTHKLISWKVEQMCNDSKQPFATVDQYLATLVLANALLILKDEKHLITAAEVLLGEPESNSDPPFCDYCHKNLKTPFLQGDQVQDPLLLCVTCPLIELCPDCKERSARENLRGCYKHEFIEIPTASWFTRKNNIVNEEGQTEKEWLESLLKKYEELKEKDFDTSDLPRLVTDYEDQRPSIFDMCQGTDLSQLVRHLETYPRDIALKDESGATVVTKVLELGITDYETLQLLEVLASEGARLLVYDNKKTSTIELACRNGYKHSLTFLLEQFDPDFDRVKDPYSSDALQMMIDNKWSKALRFAIERHFDWSTSGKFDWLQQCPTLHLTDDEIINLLNNAPASSIRTTNPQQNWVAFPQPLGSDLPKLDTHYERCVHNELKSVPAPLEAALASLSGGSNDSDASDRKLWMPDQQSSADYGPEDEITSQQDEDEEDESEDASCYPEDTGARNTAATFCGLAGVFPNTSGHADFKSVAKGLCDVSLVYKGKIKDQGTDLAGVRETLLSAGRGLLHAIALAQKARLCCESFTVLHVVSGPKARQGSAIISLSRVPIQLVVDFVELIKQAPNEHNLSSTHLTTSIFECCDFSIKPPGPSAEALVNHHCLAMQLLCLGFVSFLSGHLSKAEIPNLSTKISRYFLLGCTGKRQLELGPRKMACVGEMIKDELLAFAVVESEDNSILPANNFTPFYLQACIEDILELWGPAKCFYKQDWDGISEERFVAVYIRQGLISLDRDTNGDIKTAHWSQKMLNFSALLPAFSANEELLIGTRLKLNTDCRFEPREAWRKANAAAALVPLHTQEGFWGLATRQISLQLSAPFVSVSLQQGYTQFRGLTMKDAVMNLWDDRDPKELNRPWGVILSLCTGFAERVPLRVCVAEVLEQYLKDIPLDGPSGYTLPHDWSELKIALIKYLGGIGSKTYTANQNFIKFWTGLRPPTRLYAGVAIDFALRHLQHTGLDNRTGTFKIAWADSRDPFRAFEFSSSGKHVQWLQLLQDSNVATFAVATPRCLVSRVGGGLFGSRKNCRCSDRNDAIPPPITIKLLQTKVLPTGSYEQHWRLSSDRNYLFQPTRLTEIACQLEIIDVEPGTRRQKKYLVVVGHGNFARNFIEYIRKKAAEKEEQILQENHISYRDPTPEPVKICALSQWMEQQNQHQGLRS